MRPLRQHGRYFFGSGVLKMNPCLPMVFTNIYVIDHHSDLIYRNDCLIMAITLFIIYLGPL